VRICTLGGEGLHPSDGNVLALGDQDAYPKKKGGAVIKRRVRGTEGEGKKNTERTVGTFALIVPEKTNLLCKADGIGGRPEDIPQGERNGGC